MRLEKEITRKGYWWLPDKPDDKKFGTLEISAEGKISVDLVGVFNHPLERALKGEIVHFTGEVDVFDRIEGILENGDYVILKNCHTSNPRIAFGGISTSRLKANFAYVGGNIENLENFSFSKLIFSFDGLSEWLNIAGIELEPISEFEGIIKYKPVESIEFLLENNTKVSFDFGLNLSPHPLFHRFTTNAKVSQNIAISLEFEAKKNINEILDLIRKILNFFCFAIDRTVSLNSIKLYVDSEKSDLGYTDFYYQSRISKEMSSKIDVHYMLFHFHTVSDVFGTLLSNWLKQYEILQPTFDLYFSVIWNSPTLENRFLLLAHALEVFHRKTYEGTSMPSEEFTELSKILLDSVKDNDNFQNWVEAKLEHGNELYLRQRLNLLIEPFQSFFESKKAIKSFVFKFCATRNCLTHYSEAACQNACKGEDLYHLSNKSEALLQLYLLKLIGIENDKFDELNNDRILRKIYRKTKFL